MTIIGDPAQMLRRTYLFSALDDEQLRTVVASMQELNVDEGRKLFEHGQPADKFFLLCEGQVKLYRLSEEGDEKVIEIVRPGQTFAEAVMFMSGRVYPVNADALVKSRLLAFPNAVFKDLLRNSVDACFRLMADMSQRLHQRLNEIDSLTLHNATYRLVTYLLGELPEGCTDLHRDCAHHAQAHHRLTVVDQTRNVLAYSHAAGTRRLDCGARQQHCAG